jgi:gluconolactonase
MAHKVKLYASGFGFPEGPAFDRDGNLFIVNLQGGYLSKITCRKRSTKWIETGGTPNGSKFHHDGRLFVCDSGLRAILDVAPDGSFTKAVTNCDGEEFRGPNDLVFSSDGGFYFTDPVGSSAENPIGSVYRVNPDGTTHRGAQNLAFPNGICLSADGRRLFVAETHLHRIHEYALNANGLCAAGRIHTELPHEGEGPDGMALDIEGNLYVAAYGMGKILIVDRWGHITDEIELPGKTPTNVAFGGRGRKKLFITETETNSVYVVKIGIAGLPLYGEL